MEGYDTSFEAKRSIVDAPGKPDTVVMPPLPRDSRSGSFDLSTDLNTDPSHQCPRRTRATRAPMFDRLLQDKP
ncbi:hypothetical protein [Aquabacterium sp.]|uniref:hypothetical protein n=1 Tax=Aquabacterium sp. TaxID=1872578 RepID=UPI002C4655AD|nr:hypothetical protein [Aquabacterium sp.]HSW09252.1 hypothetical protein [Aquabacterium sp.]